MTVSMAASVRMAMLMKEAETEKVDEKAEGSDDENHLGIVDLLGLVEALQALDGDGKTQGHQKHGVDHGAQHLGPGPAVRVLVPGLWRHPHRRKGHHQRRDVGQHVEGVGDQRHGVGDVAHHDLDQEEAGKRNIVYDISVNDL